VAGFVVAITGDIMTMPGLPKLPAAQKIDIADDGDSIGVILKTSFYKIKDLFSLYRKG